MRPRAAASCGSTWRTRRRPTARSRSTGELRADGHENVGVVLQAYLRRTRRRRCRGLDNVRLCKGIYVEPAELAFQDVDEVRANYVRCLEALVAQGAYVGIATHDEHLIGEALRVVASGLAPRAVRVPDAPRRAARPRGRAGRGGAPAARLRPVRERLVRVLRAASAGEPQAGGLRRRRHCSGR